MIYRPKTSAPSFSIAYIDFRKGFINPPNCIILDSRLFDNFVLTGEHEPLQGLETCASNNNNFCGKLVWSSLELPITYDERFKVTSAPFVISDFNLFSCESKVLYLKCYI